MDIDQVIRRWLAGEKIRAIARLTGSDRNTVRRIVRLAEEVGIRAGTPWPDEGKLQAVRQSMGRPAKNLMHCFYPRGLLPVQFAAVETLEIGKLDYPALRIDFSGSVADPTQYGVFAKPIRQHVHVMNAWPELRTPFKCTTYSVGCHIVTHPLWLAKLQFANHRPRTSEDLSIERDDLPFDGFHLSLHVFVAVMLSATGKQSSC